MENETYPNCYDRIRQKRFVSTTIPRQEDDQRHPRDNQNRPDRTVSSITVKIGLSIILDIIKTIGKEIIDFSIKHCTKDIRHTVVSTNR